ncbi:ACP S-malonyltransferase [Candidatus Saccharibacteria bacterium]|nr:ACP S-malonyltransferase [Candidatus Saccharibacteria bacterium]
MINRAHSEGTIRFRNNGLGLLVPGQGSGEKGMAQEAYENSDRARRVFEVGSKITKIDLVAVCFGDLSQELGKTEVAQPVLSAAYLADFIYLQELGIQFDAGEGHSMGEIPLLAMAEVITVEGMFKLIKARGAATAKANSNRPGMMARAQGMNIEQLEKELAELLKTGRLYITNFNTKLQHMLSGDEDLIMLAKKHISDRARLVADLKDARISRSRIAGAFHSPYHMVPAKRRFKKVANSLEYGAPRFDIMLNNGLYLDELGVDNLSDYLTGQLIGKVLFSKGTERLINDGVTNFIQVGPRPVLSDLVLEDFDGMVKIIKVISAMPEKQES